MSCVPRHLVCEPAGGIPLNLECEDCGGWDENILCILGTRLAIESSEIVQKVRPPTNECHLYCDKCFGEFIDKNGLTNPPFSVGKIIQNRLIEAGFPPSAEFVDWWQKIVKARDTDEKKKTGGK